MKKSLKRAISFMLMLVLIVAMAMPVYASAKINKKSVVLLKGQTVTLKVTGIKGKTTWSTNKKSVATVKNGKVTAKKAGTAKITAKVGKKKFNSTIKVEDPKLSKTSISLTEGSSATISLKGTSQKITWSTSNKAIATVKNGRIVGVKPGTATITAKVLGKKFNCKVTVKAKQVVPTPTPTPEPPKFTSSDYKVTYGTQDQYVEFKIAEGTSKEELIEAGYTVVGDTASIMHTVKTATYTFDKLPTNLSELKAIKLDSIFAPMAAGIVAITTWENMPVSQGMYNHPLFDMFDYLTGPNLVINNVQKSESYTTMQTTFNKSKFHFFDGATPSNNYTPNKPYTFTLVEGPYVLPEKPRIGGGKHPLRHMVLITFAGDDAQRYCDVYQSSDGNYYLYERQWKHLCAGVKDVEQVLLDYEDVLSSDIIADDTLKIETIDDASVEATEEIISEETISDEVVVEDEEITEEILIEE